MIIVKSALLVCLKLLLGANFIFWFSAFVVNLLRWHNDSEQIVAKIITLFLFLLLPLIPYLLYFLANRKFKFDTSESLIIKFFKSIFGKGVKLSSSSEDAYTKDATQIDKSQKDGTISFLGQKGIPVYMDKNRTFRIALVPLIMITLFPIYLCIIVPPLVLFFIPMSFLILLALFYIVKSLLDPPLLLFLTDEYFLMRTNHRSQNTNFFSPRSDNESFHYIKIFYSDISNSYKKFGLLSGSVSRIILKMKNVNKYEDKLGFLMDSRFILHEKLYIHSNRMCCDGNQLEKLLSLKIKKPESQIITLLDEINKENYIPNIISKKTRAVNIGLSIFLFIYLAYSLAVGKFAIPLEDGIWYLRGTSVYFMLASVVFYISNLIATLVDHYDTRDNEILYQKAKHHFLLYSTILYCTALLIDTIQN